MTLVEDTPNHFFKDIPPCSVKYCKYPGLFVMLPRGTHLCPQHAAEQAKPTVLVTRKQLEKAFYIAMQEEDHLHRCFDRLACELGLEK